MKFKINSKMLLGLVSGANKAINAKAPNPILENCLLRWDNGVLTVTGSDANTVVTMRSKIESSDMAGEICVNAKRLADLLKAMPSCSVTLECGEKSVSLRSETGKYNLATVDKTQYTLPELSTDNAEVTFKLSASCLEGGMDNVGFASSKESLRPILQGILFDVSEDAIVFVATDTHILAKLRDTSANPGCVCSFVLPEKSASILQAILPPNGEITITKYHNCVVFDCEDFRFQSTLINGNFPAYDRVIPRDFETRIVIDNNGFISALNCVSVCASRQTPMISIKPSGNVLEIATKDNDFQNDALESTGAEITGNQFEICFHATFLKDIMTAIKSEKVVMKLKSPSTPGLFLPYINREGCELTVLCMPMASWSSD